MTTADKFPLMTAEDIADSKAVISSQKMNALRVLVEWLLSLEPQQIRENVAALMKAKLADETKMAIQFFVFPSTRRGFSDMVYEMLKSKA